MNLLRERERDMQSGREREALKEFKTIVNGAGQRTLMGRRVIYLSIKDFNDI